jgi:hypothetical protein
MLDPERNAPAEAGVVPEPIDTDLIFRLSATDPKETPALRKTMTAMQPRPDMGLTSTDCSKYWNRH